MSSRSFSSVEKQAAVVVIGGPNGAGKSTTAPAIVRQAFGIDEFVNADTIASGLSAFAPEQVAIAAGRIMLGRIRALADERKSFAFETTLASLSFGPLLRRMQGNGYAVHVVFFGCQLLPWLWSAFDTGFARAAIPSLPQSSRGGLNAGCGISSTSTGRLPIRGSCSTIRLLPNRCR